MGCSMRSPGRPRESLSLKEARRIEGHLRCMFRNLELSGEYVLLLIADGFLKDAIVFDGPADWIGALESFRTEQETADQQAR